jgi:sulfate/thiosulfate transport system ATP-binding protein
MSIEVRHVSKTFGKFAALRDIDLRIEEGELVALLGPSGSGKTTLLRIIAGLDVPDPGPETSVRLRGRDIADRDPARRRVGFVFQHYALFRNMTVFDNIAFGLRVRPRAVRPSRDEIRAKVEELLKLIHLEPLAGRYPSQLSGGQRQRVALARALAIEPEVLLLDEPFGALDARVRQDLRNWLRRLHDKIGVTSLLVTHDQDEALEVADRIVVMNQGRIEQSGTPDEVFHHPASEFVIGFLGNVNLFHGRMESGQAVYGPLAVSAAAGGPGDGARARIFVRPHDFDIRHEHGGRPSFKARIERIHSAGPAVRIEVVAESGERILVEMPHDRFRNVTLRANDEVYLSPRDARVFLEDYSI